MKQLKLCIVFTTLLVGGLLLPAAIAHADSSDLTTDTGCDPDNLPSYTGTLELPTESYDVYVRLSKRGEQAQVRGYAQFTDNYGGCQQLGDKPASGDRWTKLGELVVPTTTDYTLELASPALDKLPDANRPAVMLIPHDKPICDPDQECLVTVDGQTGYVRPTGTLLNEDSLHVLLVTDPSASKIKQVRYYVDNRLVYSLDRLRPFDLRYVSYPRQKLTRAIEYTSGQQVILPGEAPADYVDSFGNVLFRLGRSYPRTVTIVTIILLMALVMLAILMLGRAIWHHRNWEYNHGILHKAEHHLTPRERELLVKRQNLLAISKLTLVGSGVLVAATAVVILANMYLAQIFTVDGRSMRNTMFTGERMLINKAPRSLATANGREFIPKRGDVVVARAVFGNSMFGDNNPDTFFIIKRVIGLPGERVVIKDGVLTIYNNEHPDGFQPDKDSPWSKTMIPNDPDEQLDLQLGSSELFLSGDNRPESVDSRFNGAIASKEIVGNVAFKLWPPFGHSHPQNDE